MTQGFTGFRASRKGKPSHKQVISISRLFAFSILLLLLLLLVSDSYHHDAYLWSERLRKPFLLCGFGVLVRATYQVG